MKLFSLLAAFPSLLMKYNKYICMEIRRVNSILALSFLNVCDVYLSDLVKEFIIKEKIIIMVCKRVY